MESRVPQPIISDSLKVGLEDSFDSGKLAIIKQAIERINFEKVYIKIELIIELVGENGSKKIPASKQVDTYNATMDFSQFFPNWSELSEDKKNKIVAILNEENLRTFSIRVIPNNNHNYIEEKSTLSLKEGKKFR